VKLKIRGTGRDLHFRNPAVTSIVSSDAKLSNYNDRVGGLGSSTSLTTLFVSLKAFDVLGREVATIISEQLPAGGYTRQSNSEGLSDGDYFYRPTSGNLSATKKMLLMK